MEQTNNKELKLEEIDKWYNKKSSKAVHALKSFSYTFVPGIYGLIGKNGAGKSTLINILTGYILKDNGKIFFDGSEIDTRTKEYKSLIGYMPQTIGVYDSMTCKQFLEYISALKGLKNNGNEVNYWISKVHLDDKKDCKISELSGGMRQRLLFAQSQIGNPYIVLLDEPTAGVDPDERDNLKNSIKEHCKEKIVIISTHILTDLADLATDCIELKNRN